MKNFSKRIISAILTVSMLFTLSASAFAEDISSKSKPILLSSQTTLESPYTIEEVKTYVDESGNTIVDTYTTVYHQNPFSRISPETSDRSATRDITSKEGTLLASMSVSATFEWDGTSCIVSNEQYDYSIEAPNHKMPVWKTSSANAGTFNKAYCKVDYKVTNQIGANVGSGKLEVTCSKTGKE